MRNFCIIRAGEGIDRKAAKPCNHYVAVSYCWPETTNDGRGNAIRHKSIYNIRLNDRVIRGNRAPAEVISRAVQFARENKIRFVWIDQECINQDDPKDKEHGIQSMDMVYQQACVSIGLFNAEIQTQSQLEALNQLYKWGNDGGNSDLVAGMSEIADPLLEVLETLMKDRWTTRAWILQESFSAGQNMVLLIKRGSGIRESDTEWSSHFVSSDEVAMDFNRFLNCITFARWFFAIRSQNTTADSAAFSSRIKELMNRISWFHPISSHSARHEVSFRPELRSRIMCSAAMALSFLRMRFNSYLPDRLAILANLCDWDVRLDTKEIEKNHQSLSNCIFVLAILNGDHSLLYPEVYDKIVLTSNGKLQFS